MIPLANVRAMLAAATPGPWRREREDGTIGSSVVADAHDDQVADATGQAPMRDIERRPVHEVQRANAALIAAAPDLAAQVLTLAAALETAERERDAARSAHAELAAAVREEREAERGHAAVRADDASRGRHLRAAEAAVDKARHATDAILSAAPPRSTVDARVVREVIAARAALIAVSSERRDVWTRVDHGQRENAASARLVAAEAALDAALAAAGCP